MSARVGQTRRWLGEQVAPLRVRQGLGIILDPDRLIDRREAADLAPIEITTDWLSLRRAYERAGRHLRSDERLVLLHQEFGVESERDLPFDISRRAHVIRVRPPGPRELAALTSSLPDDELEHVLAAVRRRPADPVAAAVEALAGVALDERPVPLDQLRAAIRLAANPASEPLRSSVCHRLTLPEARSLLGDPPDPAPLQALWEAWSARGPTSAINALVQALASELTLAHLSGILHPAPVAAKELPHWARIGTVSVTPEDRLDELMAAPPEPWPPATADDWIGVARWWGDVRLALAQLPEELVEVRQVGDDRWQDIHELFVPWLRENLGGFMTGAAAWPRTIDRVPAMLARRLRAGQAERALLLVIDGMGFSQWARIRRELTVLDAGGVFTLVPTLTSICRQALLAGELPLTFSDTLEMTSAENKRWTTFWETEGASDAEVKYFRASGGADEAVPGLEHSVTAAQIVTGLDGILHGTKLTGDRGVDAALGVWLDGGYVQRSVKQATESGFEVWITSDHGNIECEGTGLLREGSAVEEPGARVRSYTTPAMRDRGRATGDVWPGEPPGLPAEGPAWLFAPGRTAFASEKRRVAHGGFSLDEVIVPLARVAF